jgi:antitoxin CcdA
MKASFSYDNSAPKRALSLSINSNLLEEVLTKKKCMEWLEQNREALEAYNERVEKRGVFSDGLRTF